MVWQITDFGGEAHKFWVVASRKVKVIDLTHSE